MVWVCRREAKVVWAGSVVGAWESRLGAWREHSTVEGATRGGAEEARGAADVATSRKSGVAASWAAMISEACRAYSEVV